eukprot:NODE_11157_length_1304_cov_2.392523.p1 GENE.NODE_11157_length_1304_cov_2.392523~~NODE_11157_length_1304_cov_2.392523.p1  ORF type:complete len:387 (-),score=116.55 NODE_11157_length_1304_cov_2.392523:142-1257(-)
MAEEEAVRATRLCLLEEMQIDKFREFEAVLHQQQRQLSEFDIRFGRELGDIRGTIEHADSLAPRMLSELGDLRTLVEQEREARHSQIAEVHDRLLERALPANVQECDEAARLLKESRLLIMDETRDLLHTQELALSAKIDEFITVFQRGLDHEAHLRGNSLKSVREAIEIERQSLEQEVADREAEEHNLQMGVNELREKADAFKCEIDEVTRRLWDAIEMHTHDIRMNDLVDAEKRAGSRAQLHGHSIKQAADAARASPVGPNPVPWKSAAPLPLEPVAPLPVPSSPVPMLQQGTVMSPNGELPRTCSSSQRPMSPGGMAPLSHRATLGPVTSQPQTGATTLCSPKRGPGRLIKTRSETFRAPPWAAPPLC